jgi:hypothetical protein
MCGAVGCATAVSPIRDASMAPAGAGLSEAPLSADTPLTPLRSEVLTATPVATHSRATHASDRSEPEVTWLSPSHIGAAVRAHYGDFQACQALGDLESRREDGAVTVGWLVKADGSVNQVTVGASSFTSSRINTCVLDVARQVTFPRSAAPTQVSWTVKFRGAPQGPFADASPR